MSRYLVAIKSGKESAGVRADSVTAVPGVSLIGDRRKYSVLIEADSDAIEQVRKRFGEYLRVEEEKFYKRS